MAKLTKSCAPSNNSDQPVLLQSDLNLHLAAGALWAAKDPAKTQIRLRSCQGVPESWPSTHFIGFAVLWLT